MDIKEFFDGEGEISENGWNRIGQRMTYATSMIFSNKFPPKSNVRATASHTSESDPKMRLSLLEDQFARAVIRQTLGIEDAQHTDELRTQLLADCSKWGQGARAGKHITRFEDELKTFAQQELFSSWLTSQKNHQAGLG